MSLTVASICGRARQIAKCQQYIEASQDALNALLVTIAEHDDLAVARGLFQFDFNPGLLSPIFGSQFIGSGPYSLPVDYLRASGSSGDGQKTFFWTLNGVPYPMVPCDLSDFDMQVKQAGLQSYPWLMATDLSNSSVSTGSRYRSMMPVALTVGSTTATPLAMVNPGSTAPAFVVGDGIAGEGLTPGTTITVVGVTTITLSLPALATIGAAPATVAAASTICGVPPQFFVYPPPSGAYPVTIRYQKLMPPIWDPTRFPWFPNDDILIDGVAQRLMEITDDSRVGEFEQRVGRRMSRFLLNANDKVNRPQTVELDRRTFGSSFRTLKNTKRVGW